MQKLKPTIQGKCGVWQFENHNATNCKIVAFYRIGFLKQKPFDFALNRAYSLQHKNHN